MRTNIDIDDALMARAMQAVGAKTKKEAVEKGLETLIRLAGQREAWEELKGMGWDGNLDAMRDDTPPPSR